MKPVRPGEKTAYTGLEIAVIGMAGRFPGAKNIREFWANLKNGVEGISFFTDRESEGAGIQLELVQNPNYIKASGLIEDIDYFDADFFGYIPVEAELLDPQVRIFHECAWEALEDAGVAPGSYKGRIGLYAGASPHLGWEVLSLFSGTAGAIGRFAAWQLYDKDFMSTRLSYNLDLSGPSVNVQTACSTSLVAIHLACQGLLSGECHLALAGGITVSITDRTGYFYREGLIGSSDGHCRPFDAAADGTVYSEGAGVVVLKLLENAVNDRDFIYAVIKSSAVNNDGKGKVGFTAPGVKGQAGVIRSAHRLARVKPESIGYVETHGTGTNLGDPVEIEALKQAFKSDKKGFCRIGSVKSNLGHTDNAAGAAGFIKTVLALKHGWIPPSLHCENPNPKIDFENTPFIVNRGLFEWKRNGEYPRRAGVSSFGVGGTNAHVVLEEYLNHEGHEGHEGGREYRLMILSAKTGPALEKMTGNLVNYLKQNPHVNLADAAYTLQVGRWAFDYRRMFLWQGGRGIEEAVGNSHSFHVEVDKCPVIFMFPGQGSQYANMGLDLYKTQPVFRKEYDRCTEALSKVFAGVQGAVFSKSAPWPPEAKIKQTEIAQPFLFAFEYALARLLMHWGIKPYAMIGHSIGEYVAACLSGVFSLEDALEIVALRGRSMQEMPPGSMLGVSLAEGDLKPLLSGEISLAAVNSPGSCVVSGSHEAVGSFSKRLTGQGIENRILHTSHAFHSPMMDPILKEFTESVGRFPLNKPKIPYISNLTGQWITVENAVDPGYWARHLRETVQFSRGLKELLKIEDAVLLEVGPGKALATFARQHLSPGEKEKHIVMELVRHPKQNQADDRFLLEKVGRLWLGGVKIDWPGFYSHEKRNRVPLPTYPFEGRHFPIAGNPLKIVMDMAGGKDKRKAPLAKKRDISDWFYVPTWEKGISSFELEFPGRLGWLVFSDGVGLGSRLVEKLGRMGQQVIVVEAGSVFEEKGDRSFVIDPGRGSDYERLFAGLQKLKRVPHKILHLWCVEDTAVRERGFYSLLDIAKALGKQGITGDIHIGVVTANMQEVLGVEELCPGKAVLLGAVNVISREYANLRCCSMDILDMRQEQLPERLLAEFAAGLPDPVIALRGNHRWLPKVKPAPSLFTEPKPIGREKGVYLITGGLGGIGLTLAGHLAETLKARLVLVGRSFFPAREEWSEWLAAHHEQDDTAVKIKKILAMEKYGAEVSVCRADVADRVQMQEVIALTRERFGSIHGVIHSAGAADGSVIQRRTREMSEGVFAAKIGGTLVLDALLKEGPLDFFVLCSSLASQLAPVGQAAYTAANAFLDAFADYKSAKDNTFCVAINWDSWQEVGMAVKAVRTADSTDGADIPGGPKLEAAHPLFDYRIEKNSNENIYVSRFRADTHWVMDEHRVLGKPTLPGTALVEMARAAFDDCTGGQPVEIHDLYFLTPLRLEENEEKEVHTVLEKHGPEEGFKFTIRSRSNPIGDKYEWMDHAVGQLAPGGAEAVKKNDIKEILARCDEEEIIISEEMPGSGRRAGRLGFDLGPRWESVKRVNFGGSRVLVLLELPEAFSGDIGVYKLHPALLDAAVGYFALMKSNAAAADEASLPFSYKKIAFRKPLSRRVYSYQEYEEKEGEAGKEKIVGYNITIMDEKGVVLAEIEDYKRMSLSQGAVGRLSADKAAELIGHGLLPSEGIEVFRRVLGQRLPRVVVSTRDFGFLTAPGALPGPAPAEELAKPAGPLRPRPRLGKAYAPPTSETEKKIARIWQDFLGIGPIGIHDDFFELGGDSLKITTIASKIHKTLQVEVPLGELFDNPSIAGIAAYIAGAKKVAYTGIGPVEKKEYYSLSSTQKRLFIVTRMAPDSTAYNLTQFFQVKEKNLDGKKIEEIFRKLITGHESLRTSFQLAAGEPVQIINRDDPVFTMEYYDMPGTAADITREFVRPFDLSRAPLFRVGLVNGGGQGYLLMVDLHHIIADGTSQMILIEDFVSLYSGEALPPLKIHYKDFSGWQNRLFESGMIKTQEDYWLELYADAGELPGLLLPADHKRPGSFTFAGDRYGFRFEKEDVPGFNALGAGRGATLYMNILAVLNVLFYKYSGQEDIIIGSGIAGRRHADLFRIIGMFVNTLAMRNFPYGEKTYEFFLKEVASNSMRAFDNQDVQFEDLVDKLETKRDLSRNPLFDISMVVQNVQGAGAGDTFSDKKFPFLPVEYENKTAKFDMTFYIYENQEAEEIFINIEYYTAVFKKETLRRLASHFKNIVKTVIKRPSIKLKDIDILSEEERRQVLAEFNDTAGEYPADKTLHGLFADQAAKTADNTALVGPKLQNTNYETLSISYRELNGQSDRLAYLLSQKGVIPGSIVGLMVERSIEMIIGILGILKSGGAYLPIDPGYPTERIDYMLADSGAKVLVTEVELDTGGLKQDTAPSTLNNPLAYVMYTSGTTGRPKGILTVHSNVIRLVRDTNYIDLTGRDRILQLSNYAFDGSVFDIYGALLNGAALVMIGREDVLSVDKLSGLLEKEGITIFFVTTALFNALVDLKIGCFDRIRKVLFGGERVSVEHSKKALEYLGKDKIIHVYGPTETTVYATYYDINDIPGTVPIGGPISNTSVYLLDKNLQPVPVMVNGEIYIGGDGVARGYLNNPELTAEKFLTAKTREGARRINIYRTGDLAHRLPDGDIEFSGRIDHQVKIRGFRIEPGEIEARLLKHEAIKEAVVLTGEGDRYLCAYIAAADSEGSSLTASTLREYLSGYLPDYMIPSHFVLVDRIPLTANGKVDKKVLASYASGGMLGTGVEYAAPGTDAERIIAAIWAEVLHVDKPGLYDNFFDLGGNSMALLKVNSRLREVFKKDIPIAALFQYPTVGSLAHCLGAAETDAGRAEKDAARLKTLSRGKTRIKKLVKRTGEVKK